MVHVTDICSGNEINKPDQTIDILSVRIYVINFTKSEESIYFVVVLMASIH